MKKFALILTILVILASCGPAPTPSPTPDINATMSAFSGTMVAGTLTAQPTNTMAPTNTPEPTATATIQPTVEEVTPPADGTFDPSVPTATLDPNATPGPTPTVFIGTFSVGDLPESQRALLRVENVTGAKEIIVTLNGVTKLRSLPLYISYKITGALNITIYIGSWDYKVEIPGRKYMTGSFRQTNKDKTTMYVYFNKVAVKGP